MRPLADEIRPQTLDQYVYKRQVVRRVPTVDYPLLIASAYSGFVIWHAGLSGSIPLDLVAGCLLYTSQIFVKVLGHRGLLLPGHMPQTGIQIVHVRSSFRVTCGSDSASRSLSPVSYTHLDVYKRQALYRTVMPS